MLRALYSGIWSHRPTLLLSLVILIRHFRPEHLLTSPESIVHFVMKGSPFFAASFDAFELSLT